MNHLMYDAIVIGSGAGGAAAAHRLVGAGWRVLLVEKGAPLPIDGSTLDVRRVVGAGEFLSREPWLDGSGREFAPEEHFNLGGKTKWYGAAVLRFGQHEFEADPTHQCRAWPIGYRDLAPYYAQAENLLGVREFGCEPDLARISSRLCRPHGWYTKPLPMALSADIVHDRNEAAHFDGFATVRDLKSDAENTLIRPIAGAPNFTLMTGAIVDALLPSPDDARRIEGVRLVDGREFRARHVMLAAGALHSPRLVEKFLRTHAIEGALAANVGRNLKLHLLTAMVAVSPSRKTDLIRKTTLLLNEAYPHSSVQALGFDAELIGNLIPRLVPRVVARQVAERAYGFFLQTEDGSSIDNRVAGMGNGNAKPLMDYSDARVMPARREHRRFVFGFQRALARAGMLSFTQRIGLAGTAHVCGTLVTGSDPENSVVDASGRVHGLEGLYVVDGSILPRSSRVNPSLTIFAWALRTADLLARSQAARRSSVVTSIDAAVGEPA